MDAVMPLLKIADSLPQNAPKPEMPEMSACLEWEARVEKWGLPNPGTWLDQPKWFMEDIRAAGSGRLEWMEKETGPDLGLPADIPQTNMVVQR